MGNAVRHHVSEAAEGMAKLAAALRRAREDLADVKAARAELDALEGLAEYDRLQRLACLAALQRGAKERLRALMEALAFLNVT
jgi:Lon protease-like protein